MNIDQLLALLKEKNIALAIDRGDLVIRGEKSALDAGVVTLLRTHKQALLEAVATLDGVASANHGIVPPNAIIPGSTTITPDMLPLVDLTQREIDEVVAAVPGGAPNIQDIYRLAPLQHGMLFHYLLERESDPYLLDVLWRFDSRSQLERVLTGLQAALDRHDVLRTCILWEALSEPVQVVQRDVRLPIEELSIDTATEDVAQELLDRFDPQHYRMDIRRAPMLRCAVAYDAANDSWLMMLLVHHLVVDHVSLEILVGEIHAHLAGEEGSLPPPVPFRTFVALAQNEQRRRENETFFKDMLGDVDEPTLPFGLRDAQGNGSRIVEARYTLERALAKRLRAQARSRDVSVASMLHVAWGRVLSVASSQESPVFGTVLLGRMQGTAGSERAVGLMINTLPVRVDVAASVEHAIRNVHVLLADLVHHEQAPLALAQSASGVVLPDPLFSSVFNYRHSSAPSTEAPGIWNGIEILRTRERTNYPFGMSVDDLGDDIVLTAQVASPLDPEMVCAMTRTTLEQLVELLEMKPSAALREIRVLPAAELRRMVVEWNATEAAYPSDACIHELFEAQVEKSADSCAVVCGTRSLTYAELNAEANRLARYLRTFGVGPDTRVVVCMDRGVELIVGILAVLKAGGAYVPLDPSHPLDRLTRTVKDCSPVAILTNSRMNPGVREAFASYAIPVLEMDREICAWETLPAENLERDGLVASDVAYIIYTSGSTGEPKGVMIEHRSVCNLALEHVKGFSIGHESRVLQFASVSFDASVSEIFSAFCAGAALYLPPLDSERMGQPLAAMMDAYGITHVTLPPAVLTTLSPASDLHTVETLVLAGEAFDASLVNQWTSGRRVINAYGPTEGTVCTTLGVCPEHSERPPSIGRPIGNVRVYVLDESLQPVPVGVAGELYIGGAGVARGYWNRAELTAERFIASPFVAGDRLYKTGDLVRYLPDGTIEFVGRNDFQVKIRGFRVELGEIESRLGAYAGIREALVLAREDVPGAKRLVAYYTCTSDAEVSVAALRAHLASSLPEYMVPAAFVRMEAFALTPNGKVDRKALPAPDGSSYAQRVYEEPAGELEQSLARMWCEVLKLDRVGRTDNFFELGGTSLSAVALISGLRLHDVDVSLDTLYAKPILSQLAEGISAMRHTYPRRSEIDAALSQDGGFERAVLIQPGHRDVAPVFCVAGAGDSAFSFAAFAGELGDEQPVYGLQARGLDGVTSPDRSVEISASRCVRAIAELCGDAPIHLVGHSFGGWVAFEIALQLADRGQRLASLTLVDAQAPDETRLTRSKSRIEAALDWIALLELGASRSLDIPRAALSSDADDLVTVRVVHEAMVRKGILSVRSHPETLLGAFRTFEAASNTAYVPRRAYEDPLLFILAHDSRLSSNVNQVLQTQIEARWRKWAPALTPWSTSGNHVTVLRVPHVESLASRWIDAISADNIREK